MINYMKYFVFTYANITHISTSRESNLQEPRVRTQTHILSKRGLILLLPRENARSLARTAFKTIALSGSGALSPGPLSASAAALGAIYGWFGGLLVAAGHMLFELPYVAILVASAAFLERVLRGKRRALLEGFAGIFMLFFAYGLFSLAFTGGSVASSSPLIFGTNGILTPLIVGFALTALNPYFLAWWLTVGKPIVDEAGRSKGRFTFVYASHVWMDYAWLTGLAVAGGVSSVLGGLWYRGLLFVLGLFLVYYGVKFTVSSVKSIITEQHRRQSGGVGSGAESRGSSSTRRY